MGDKYIIELEDKPVCVFDEDTQTFFPRLHRVKGFNSLVFDQNGLDKLTPYTEPDLDAIRKEAYEKGLVDGNGVRKSEINTAYQRGLDDAWETTRKIILDKEDGGLDPVTYNEIFGYGKGVRTVLKTFTASEAVEKIRQYERKKEIQVGDEVVGTYTGGEETEPFVIIRKIPEVDPTYYFGIYSKSGEFCQGGLKLKKTGRHFTEIAEVLEKMKENSDG